jgi:hypothetical protein
MAKSPFTTATLTYMVKGKVQSKKVSIPAQRYNLGIPKQGHDYVELSWFKVNPEVGGYGPDNYKIKRVQIPRDAGLVTLWVGKRALRKAN